MRATPWILGFALLMIGMTGVPADDTKDAQEKKAADDKAAADKKAADDKAEQDKKQAEDKEIEKKKAAAADEGFVRTWLVLAPIALGATESAPDALDKQQIKDEAKLNPKAGDKVKVGDKELVWKALTSKEDMLDFNAFLGAETDDSVGYAVTIIVAPEEMKGVKMKTGSDDQMKVYLNGKEVIKVTDARPADTDQDTTEVTLQKGENVLVAKVINEKVEWKFCVRFCDRDDKPIKSLKAKVGE